MKLDLKRHRRDRARVVARREAGAANRTTPDGERASNKPYHKHGQLQLTTIVRRRLARGDRRLIVMKLHEAVKTKVFDDFEDLDVFGKLPTNLIGASAHHS